MTRRPRRWRRAALAVLGFAVVLGLCSGTSTVRAPGGVREPVTVYLFRDQLHVGLVLPRAGGHVEFGFGDWDWYALGNDAWYDAVDTVLWPTQGALMRREIPARDAAALDAWYWSGTLTPLIVERARMRAVRAALDERYAAGAGHFRHAGFRADFVRDEESYWFGNNCHDTVAAWLRALDCEVSWVVIRWGLRVEG